MGGKCLHKFDAGREPVWPHCVASRRQAGPRSRTVAFAIGCTREGCKPRPGERLGAWSFLFWTGPHTATGDSPQLARSPHHLAREGKRSSWNHPGIILIILILILLLEVEWPVFPQPFGPGLCGRGWSALCAGTPGWSPPLLRGGLQRLPPTPGSWSTFPTVTRSGNRPSKMENAKLLKWAIQNEVTGQNEKSRTRKTWDDHPGDLKPQHYFVALMKDSTQIVQPHGPKDIFPTKVHCIFFHLLVREIRVLRYLNLTKTRLPQHFVQASRQASLQWNLARGYIYIHTKYYQIHLLEWVSNNPYRKLPWKCHRPEDKAAVAPRLCSPPAARSASLHHPNEMRGADEPRSTSVCLATPHAIQHPSAMDQPARAGQTNNQV